ncbi:MAG: polyprenyl synthetase family protein [Kyrpidia tusciae]|nr:polyprenyl synthetase family protein [Kyrpidia tusciae]MBE3551256.1 polyprenyl synthetase family protein [Kyrpidia tusciae]
MRVTELYGTMRGELRRVEDLLEEEVASREPALQEASLYLLRAGGKRLRPLMVLVSGRFGPRRDTEALVRAAAALEMIHMATLVHDDVIDRSDTRRGRPTVKAAWGDQLALYTGDFLFARALELLSEMENRRLHEVTAWAIARMCQGELEQMHDLYRIDQPLFRYYRRIRQKTALLMAVSCLVGARASGADEETARALWRFGGHLGMAFQIVDDMLDLVGDEAVLGKPVGSDLLQGNLTLPVLFALRGRTSGDEAASRRLAGRIHPGMSQEDVAEVVRAVAESGGIDEARRVADRYVIWARRDLAALPDGWAREALEAVLGFVTARDR